MRYYNYDKSIGIGGIIVLLICVAFPLVWLPLLTVYLYGKDKLDSISQETKQGISDIIAVLIVGFILIGAPTTTLSYCIRISRNNANSINSI